MLSECVSANTRIAQVVWQEGVIHINEEIEIFLP